MEPSPPVTAKKLWNIVRIVFFMLRKGISKRKLMMELHLIIKRGRLAGKAIGNLMLHHHSNLSCRPNDAHLSFISPREYEFSCSNSPAYPSYFPFQTHKRKHHDHFTQNHHSNHNYFSCKHPTATDDSITTVNAVKKMLEMLNNEVPEASPMTFPGFGRSPMVRPLRITDSPFPLRDADEDSHVDKAAEEFIEKFYKDLKQQKRMAALEARYHEMLAAGSG